MSAAVTSLEQPTAPRFLFQAPNVGNISPKPNAMYSTWRKFKGKDPMKRNAVIYETLI